MWDCCVESIEQTHAEVEVEQKSSEKSLFKESAEILFFPPAVSS